MTKTTIRPATVNPDERFVLGLKKRLRDNNQYCPSKLEKNPDNKCPCREYREEGYCACGMYVDTVYSDSENKERI